MENSIPGSFYASSIKYSVIYPFKYIYQNNSKIFWEFGKTTKSPLCQNGKPISTRNKQQIQLWIHLVRSAHKTLQVAFQSARILSINLYRSGISAFFKVFCLPW